jgi:hypothetical protein
MYIQQYLAAVIEENTFSFSDIQCFAQFQMSTRIGNICTNTSVNKISNCRTECVAMQQLQHVSSSQCHSWQNTNNVPAMCSARIDSKSGIVGGGRALDAFRFKYCYSESSGKICFTCKIKATKTGGRRTNCNTHPKNDRPLATKIERQVHLQLLQEL